MEISEIYVHDACLLRVIEDAARDTLTMEVDLPKDEWSDEQVPRLLVFDEAYSYQVFEQPFHGSPAILDIQVVDKHERWQRVRINTNAGYRELFCTGIRVLERVSTTA